MEVIFTSHALQRMQDRGITKDETLDAIYSPDRITLKVDTKVVIKLRDTGHVLLVVLREDEGKSKVITVIDTSKVEKYL